MENEIIENKDAESLGLKTVIVRYMHKWKLFLAAFLFSFIPAVLYLAFYPQTFDFVARIQIQEDKDVSVSGLGLGEAAGLMRSFGIGGSGIGVNIEDEIAILSSNWLFADMIYDLGINVEYTRPFSFYKMYHDAPLKLSADSASMAGLNSDYRFKVSVSDGKVTVKAKNRLNGWKEQFTFASLPAQIKAKGVEFTLDFDNGASIDHDFKLNIKCLPTSWMAEKFIEEFQIEELSKSSNVIEMGCSDHVKERGRAMLNTLIEKFNANAKSFKHSKDEPMTEFVEQRIDSLLAELDDVESALEAYKTQHEMTLLESDVLFYTEQMKELQTKIVEMETQSYLIRMMDDYVKDPANRYEVVPTLIAGSVEGGDKSAASSSSGPVVSYNQAIVERDRLLKSSNENNPAFKSMSIQVDKLRNGVYLAIENANKSCEMTLVDLRAKEKTLLDKMKTVPALEHEYVSFKRRQEILQGVYLLLLQKREEMALSRGQDYEHVRIIDPAYVLKKPVGPRKLYAAIGILALTLILPVGYLFAGNICMALREEYRRTK
ncbi:MAG: tyrosine protein kinase [Tannerella sp.]|jgi:uncharacterized protein involved in exopolysaccharide biosynthesis|nr:tyrosine protein kinase [Tannerella sp.]